MRSSYIFSFLTFYIFAFLTSETRYIYILFKLNLNELLNFWLARLYLGTAVFFAFYLLLLLLILFEFNPSSSAEGKFQLFNPLD